LDDLLGIALPILSHNSLQLFEDEVRAGVSTYRRHVKIVFVTRCRFAPQSHDNVK
jgi:hypothetical protein